MGEVRDGHAAQGLFRAMMSDHPGMSTFHAESPSLAVQRVSLLLDADTRTSAEAARQMFASAVDWLLQIGFDTDGKRRVFSLVEVNEHLDGGEVTFRPLVEYRGNLQWARLDQPARERTFGTAAGPDHWQGILALDQTWRERYRAVIERRRAAFKVA